MPESSYPVWFSLVVGALSGGLAGALFTWLMGWRKANNDKKEAKIAQINALKQELRHALWLIEYNYGRITDERLPHKGLTAIDDSNVERVLFGTVISLPLKHDVKSRLQDYFQQVVYHNSLVKEQETLILFPVDDRNISIQRQCCWGEIKAICTPNERYREDDPEPSLRARGKRLLQDLDELKIR